MRTPTYLWGRRRLPRPSRKTLWPALRLRGLVDVCHATYLVFPHTQTKGGTFHKPFSLLDDSWFTPKPMGWGENAQQILASCAHSLMRGEPLAPFPLRPPPCPIPTTHMERIIPLFEQGCPANTTADMRSPPHAVSSPAKIGGTAEEPSQWLTSLTPGVDLG